MILDSLKSAINKFEEIQARTPETDTVFQAVLLCAFHSEIELAPRSACFWRLESSDDILMKEAAVALHDAAQEAVTILINASEDELATVRSFLASYCQRINFNGGYGVRVARPAVNREV